MATYKSKFVGLPKASELRALAYPNGMPDVFPYQQSRSHVSEFERKYLDEVVRCLREGKAKSSRPGQNTLMLSDVQIVLDISGRLQPALSTKFVPQKSFTVEDLWFISGSTDVAFLKQNGVPIWDEWVIPETAVFEPAAEYVAGEMLNWVRCIGGTDLYLSWREFQRDQNIGRPSVEEVLAWWATTGRDDQIAKVKLIGGSIGAGAYGTQWRRREHTELLRVTRPVDGSNANTQEQIDAFLKKNPTYEHVVTHTAAVTRGGATTVEDVVVVTTVIDQLGDAIKALRNGADSRRIILDAWNPGMVKDCALPPCHPWVQFTSHVNEETGGRELTVKITQRSSDAMLGCPFNVGQYALLGHMVAHVTGHKATNLVWSAGDFHIYEDQLPMVPTQLEREPRPVGAYVTFNPEVKEIDDFTLADIIIEGYHKQDCHPMINYPVAV